MVYHIDAKLMDLNALKERLQNTDLIPSQEPLLDGLAEVLNAMHEAGVVSVADLSKALKTSKSLSQLSQETGVGAQYLKLLNRTVNGFFPKPRPLKDFNWLDKNTVALLQAEGIKNSEHLFEAAKGRPGLVVKAGLNEDQIRELYAVSDLCRIQWVSPTFARALVAANCTSANAVANAVPEDLCIEIEQANTDSKFYKGKVGLRDVRRVVVAAQYLPLG